MQYWIGVTDNKWYQFLAALQPDEVNFWRPSGRGFGAIPVGAPFLFKLHSPQNYIVGGGFFARYLQLPLSLAWDTFEKKNGAASLGEVRRLIQGRRGDSEPNPRIGCIILNEPFFLPRDQWIPAPADWKPNIVVGKAYSTESEIGLRLWQRVKDALTLMDLLRDASSAQLQIAERQPLYGKDYLTRARLGQGMFRLQVMDAYQNRCAVTGEKAVPTLQAAHIKPFAESGPNRTENGLLLRADLHALFDHGYVTVTRDLRVEVSRRIKDEFDNGEVYYPMHGRRLVIVPGEEDERPGREFIDWHNEKVYVG
ncbi:MAG: HNH endonuclease [Candidatus Eisenbacteria bacterium]|nr:HNH endonuclease [Candidatus Eisenbacteria bacterium]